MPRRGIILVEREGFYFNPPAPAGQDIAPPSGARALTRRTSLTKIPHLRRGVLYLYSSLGKVMPLRGSTLSGMIRFNDSDFFCKEIGLYGSYK